MSRQQPTVVRRQLGLMLRRLREETGKSQLDAARAIGKDQTRLSRVEVGTGSFSTVELAALLSFLEVREEDREAVLALGREARQRRPRRSYTDVLPGSFQRLVDLEADATRISSYEIGIVPGLLQSPDYIHTLISKGDGVWWTSSDREVAGRVAFRVERQRRVLEADPPKSLHFIFTHDALHNIVGGPSVMRSQVLHLLQLMESHSNLLIQVVPQGVPNNPLLGGGIMLLDFDKAPRIGFASVVYGPSTYHDDERDTAPLARAFDRVAQLALSPDESRGRLVQQLKESEP